MTYTVRIVPNDRQFIIHSGETVLDAALNQQIAFPPPLPNRRLCRLLM